MLYYPVDGSEIRGSPVEVGSLSNVYHIYKDLHIPSGAGFLPSTVGCPVGI